MKKPFARLLSLPLLLLAAAAASAQQQPFVATKHYTERVALFSQQADIDSTKIVMLGNSLTENAVFQGGWGSLLGCNNVCNRGISGDDAQGIIRRLYQILPYRPKAIFLMCGINDLSHNLSAQEVFLLCREVIDSIRSGAPDTQLYVQSLLPFNESFKRWKRLDGRTDDVPVINQLLEAYCRQHAIPFIPLFSHFTIGQSNVLQPSLSVDGLHLSKQGYQVWAGQLRPYIEALQPTSAGR